MRDVLFELARMIATIPSSVRPGSKAKRKAEEALHQHAFPKCEGDLSIYEH